MAELRLQPGSPGLESSALTTRPNRLTNIIFISEAGGTFRQPSAPHKPTNIEEATEEGHNKTDFVSIKAQRLR
jgi:hypothetical protein